MENTTETLMQQEWRIDPHSDVYEHDSVILTTSSGFKFKVTGVKEALDIIEMLLGDGEVPLPDGSRLRTSWREWNVYLVDTDPWLNPSWNYGDNVGRIRDMLWVLTKVARDFT